jgi:hypothetical protein
MLEEIGVLRTGKLKALCAKYQAVHIHTVHADIHTMMQDQPERRDFLVVDSTLSRMLLIVILPYYRNKYGNR